MSATPVPEDNEPRRHEWRARALAFTATLLLAAGALTAGCTADPPIAEVQQGVPAADTDTTAPATPPDPAPATMAEFLTDVFAVVDGYWKDTLSASGLPQPSANYYWVGPGEQVVSACEDVADDNAAFYCPADDTIYIGQPYAWDLWAGISEGLPGSGRAYGDFAVAFTIAHEYGHNIQHELGLFEAYPELPTKPFELQADCLSGLWANSAYQAGLLEAGDVEEALATAMAIGDFEPAAADHHGFPWERTEAWLAGYNSGAPATCMSYLEV